METQGCLTRGMSIADWKGQWGKAANCVVLRRPLGAESGEDEDPMIQQVPSNSTISIMKMIDSSIHDIAKLLTSCDIVTCVDSFHVFFCFQMFKTWFHHHRGSWTQMPTRKASWMPSGAFHAVTKMCLAKCYGCAANGWLRIVVDLAPNWMLLEMFGV